MRSLFSVLLIILAGLRGFSQDRRIDSLLNVSWDSMASPLTWDTIFYTVAIPLNQRKQSDASKLGDSVKFRKFLKEGNFVVDTMFRLNDTVFITANIQVDSLSHLLKQNEKLSINKLFEDKFSNRFDFSIYGSRDKGDGTGIQGRQGADPFIEAMLNSPGPADTYDKKNADLLRLIMIEIRRCVPAYTIAHFEKIEREDGKITPADKYFYRKKKLAILKPYKCEN